MCTVLYDRDAEQAVIAELIEQHSGALVVTGDAGTARPLC
jgi:hypothetical protein